MMLQRIRRFGRQRDGVALIELALITPFLLLMFYGTVEVVRFISISQRIDKAAFTIANIVTQYPPATPLNKPGEISRTALVNDVFPQIERMMDPYREEEYRVAIISSVRREENFNMLKWQVVGGGTLSDPEARSVIANRALSEIPSGPNNVPVSFTGEAGDLLNGANGMLPNENMIVVEMFFHYRPLIRDILQGIPYMLDIGEATLVRHIYMRPRQGDLSELPS